MLLGVFLPVFNFLLLLFWGRFISQKGSLYLTVLAFYSLVVCNCYNFYLVVFQNNVFYFNLGPWIQVGLLDIQWEFLLDFISTSMLLMVSIISLAVHFYSFDYMKTDPHFIRFISYLSFFTFFMFILVTAANIVVLFVGWEGVGICSFLLINFWYTRVQANKAALKALFMNKIGDLGFLAGVVFVYLLMRTVDFSTLTVLVPLYAESQPIFYSYKGGFITYFDVIAFCFFIGVVGKSAQLGLHTWLPAAMEGPTPVSALIHAATMVTAGIFLIIRCSFLFECSSLVQNLIIVLGAATAFISAITAIFLYDIKKIIAYSTCSQLGYMAVACGFSQYTLGLFHLINHAFFKALLFLTAGAIIHIFNNEQDIRKLSNLRFASPFLHSCMLVGSIAIMGLPFLSGFYSKDVIIELAWLSTHYRIGSINIIYSLIFFSAVCTCIYSFRLYYYLFLRGGSWHRSSRYATRVYTQPIYIRFALSLLMLGSIFSGYLLSDLFNSVTPWSVASQLYIFKTSSRERIIVWYSIFENELIPWFVKVIPLISNISFVLCGFILVGTLRNLMLESDVLCFRYKDLVESYNTVYKKSKGARLFIYWKNEVSSRFSGLVKIISNNFYFNEVYNYLTVMQLSYYYSNIFLIFDKGFLEWFGPQGLTQLYLKVTKKLTIYYNQNLINFLIIIYNSIIVLWMLIEYYWL